MPGEDTGSVGDGRMTPPPAGMRRHILARRVVRPDHSSERSFAKWLPPFRNA